jgi:hypothetical protein
MFYKWAHLLTAAIVIASLNVVEALAAVHDLAAEYVNPPSASPSTNPGGAWTYGYLDSAGNQDQDAATTEYVANGTHSGFVPYAEVLGAGGGGGNGWSKAPGFPFTGVWTVPPNAGSVAPYPGLTDWPSAEGENPAYPHGVLGGHAPNTPFLSGWYAVKYTAAANETVDLDIDAWQTAIYPNVPPNPTSGGATRPQQILIQKQAGTTFTNLLRAPVGTRHGVINRDGTPEHTFGDAPSPGMGESYATQQDEIDAAIRTSETPNRYRLTNIQLNAGQSVVIGYAPYQGPNHLGFLGFNAVVRSGADRVATTSWDLSNDWSAVGSSSTGIGPDAAWSYGVLRNGSFSAYDRIKFGAGIAPEDEGTPERENHGWGTNEPGWFSSEAVNVETGPIVPGILKDSDGINGLTGGFEAGSFSQPPTGDFTGSKVVLHTPPASVDSAQTSVLRWTAPRSTIVTASGALWRATLPDATDRRHQYTLLKNGATIASGTIDELGFDCAAGGTNSACAETFNVPNISVAQGDILDLQIAPRSGGGNPVGDYNNNGTVDAADYVAWRDNLGSSNPLPNDPIGGMIGTAQYNQWRAGFGNSGGGGGPAATASFVGVDFTIVASAAGGATNVPEPTTCISFMVAAVLFCARRARKREAA